jgi:hypothetical protein
MASIEFGRWSMYDVHIDPPELRIPLPLRGRLGIEKHVLGLLNRFPPIVAEVQTSTGSIQVALHTDSGHLAHFFGLQWPRPINVEEVPQTAILALAANAATYGLDQSFDNVRSVNSARTLVASFGTEYYGNVKITTRGLCSAWSVAQNDPLFVHGSALAIEGRGALLSGTSGAGKTTITTALKSILGQRLEVVNDDWGFANVDSRSLTFTGERRLHMKYRSVLTISPDLVIDPSTHPSENYAGDPENPHARLLISPKEVFGRDCRRDAPLNLYATIFRDPKEPFSARPMTLQDVDLLADSQYSAFYRRNERFMDGSLLNLDQNDDAQTREQFVALIKSVPSFLINNNGRPDQAADAILRALDA